MDYDERFLLPEEYDEDITEEEKAEHEERRANYDLMLRDRELSWEINLSYTR